MQSTYREIELLVRRAQQASPNGKIYLPPVLHELTGEISRGVTNGRRLEILKEIKDHLTHTDLSATIHRGRDDSRGARYRTGRTAR
jgi:hypothetical protein